MPPNTLRVHTDLHAEIVEVEIEVVSPSIVPSGNFAELNRTVTCIVLKANDRRTSCPCHDEFRGPRSDYVRQQMVVHPGKVVVRTWVTRIRLVMMGKDELLAIAAPMWSRAFLLGYG
ncbi:hypothetical protein TNCV_2638691 [Trichonephila clavipes]|nr:hypothetical protein TNCV_2638691 [Trichonephila clavipes]